MKKPSFEELLDRIIEFVNVPDGAKLPLLLCGIVELSEKIGLNVYHRHLWEYPLEDKGFSKKHFLQPKQELIEKSQLIQHQVKVRLEWMLEGAFSVSVKDFTFSSINSSKSPGLQIRLSLTRSNEADPGNIAAIMALAMMIEKTKAVKKCPACDNFILIKKSMRKKFCSSGCKQKNYEANLSPEKKKKAEHRRSDWYHANKEGGSDERKS